MCVSVEKSEGRVFLRKEKLDGNVESLSFEDNMTSSIVKAIQFVGCSARGSVKAGNFLVKTYKDSNYISIKNIKRENSIFIPRSDVGPVLGKLV
jgi:hypothetical protein